MLEGKLKPGGGSKLVNKDCHFESKIKNNLKLKLIFLWKYLGEYKPKKIGLCEGTSSI
jgi:hypothetical protein